MPLAWNEIRSRAHAFARAWSDASRENADKQSFWNEFFDVFGKKRRQVASFEEPVKKLSGNWGQIDLFWPGTMIAEHKSRGGDLHKAHAQGMDYIRALTDSGRDKEIPRYLIVSDFAHIAIHDLELESESDSPLGRRLSPSFEFSLADFPKHVQLFGFIAGYRTYHLKEEDPANIEAAELLARLHDVLEDGAYPKADLDRFLVRILFCLFAEDTGIFPPNSFTDLLKNFTAEDGSNLGSQLEHLFAVLDTSLEYRQKNLPEHLADLPYVNGRLYENRLAFADFTSAMRVELLRCTNFNWSRISPAVFGSLFQAIMAPRQRRQIGAHYTSERDIMKVVRSLFLDDLHEEFKKIQGDRSTSRNSRLEAFQDKLAGIQLLDPACGCGNFLILAYRELRDLEIKVLREIHRRRYGEMQHEFSLDEVNRLAKVDVDQLYGIEIEEWPARIAEVAVWLMDHLMNQRLSAAFGQLYQRLPLKKSATIVVGNALRLDWKAILPPSDNVLILGNPPFVGAKFMDDHQRADMAIVAGNVQNFGLLDYVTGWYFKAAEYIRRTAIRCAFVSTNSISQGEQVGTLWNDLFGRYQLKIHFAHRTFAWTSEARGAAHVHVVIIGFGATDTSGKRIYDYELNAEKPAISPARNIGPYLMEGPDFAIINRSRPLCDVPEIGIGNKPIDGGHYLFTPEEKREFLKQEPDAKKYFRRWVGSEEFINGIERWCLWLGDVDQATLRTMPAVMRRVRAVEELRLASKSKPTRALAARPTRFHVENMPRGKYLVLPEVSSEKRDYIPMGFLTAETLCSNLVKIFPNATVYDFGILTSAMHMAWMRQVCGRLKSDYRYSSKLVYNNYPWPVEATPAQKARVAECAQAVLDAREPFLKRGNTFADIYDRLVTPLALVKAHGVLNRAVERCYRKEPFASDFDRAGFLFQLYEKLTAPLVAQANAKPKRATRVS
jgi:hypothetical protein